MGCLKLTYQPEKTLHIVKGGCSRELKCAQLWLSVDPLAEKYPGWSPYNYTLQNPVRYTDPTGLTPDDDIYLNKNGKEIYRVENDNPDRTFVIKTTKTTKQLYDGGSRDGWSNPISKSEARNTKKEIKSGNLEGSHMKNIVQIENDGTQQQMLDHVNNDDGGNTIISDNNLESMNPNNFKEFSGNINSVGDVVDKHSSSPVVPLPNVGQIEAGGEFDFHSHPSGQFTRNGLLGGFTQPPSGRDISSASGTEYTFGMRSKKVYIYNNSGVMAIIPFKNFGSKK